MLWISESDKEEIRIEIIRKAQEEGTISYDDILTSIPDAEQNINLLDDIMEDLLEAGIEVVATIPQEDGHNDNDLNSQKNIYIANISAEVLRLLNLDPKAIYELTPEAFELLVCNRLEAMGYNVTRVTENAYTKDGGIDIIAWIPNLAFAGLIAIQAKHHKTQSKKTGAKVVRELKGVVTENTYLQSGLVVTNTAFTKDAVWTANHSRKIMALRGWKDLIRWIRDDFSGEHIFSELPTKLELGNGIVIPRSRFNSKAT